MPASGAPLSDWLAWLETLSPTEIDLGLSRTASVLERLELRRPPHVLLIAGTNGKGSSVAMSNALLRASGFSTGAYTSPHIHRFNERIVVNGIAASDADIIAAFERVEAVRGATELTYFEFGTLAAAVVFADADVDVWILEVGLGGRLDATNAIEPTASLISNISLDHCDWLGDDVESIAAEKAGVMRTAVTTVAGSREMPAAIRDRAIEIGAVLLQAGIDFDYEVFDDGTWTWQSPARVVSGLRPPGLSGAFQIGNAAAVLMLLDAAGLGGQLNAATINSVLPGLELAGRTQIVTIASGRDTDNDWLIDVAHNPAAATELATTLTAMHCDGGTVAIVGLLEDKDLAGVIGPLVPLVDRWIAISAASHRALPAEELARQVANLSGRAVAVAETPAAAVEMARRTAAENDRILVTGSFFTVSPVLAELALISQAAK